MEEPAVEEPAAEEPAMEEPVFLAERVRAAVTNDESTLNPYTYDSGFPGWNLLTMQYDTLWTLDVSGTPQPWLVTEYGLSEDGTTYTLKLRDDVQWFDGTPFTAEDVKFTYDYFTMYPHSRFTRDITGFSSAEVLGDYEVTITLEAPNPTFILSAFADVPIIPKHVWENVTDPDNHVFESDTNIGTGPYKLMDYEPDQFYRFEANTDCWAGVPTVKELVVVRFADLTGAIAAVMTNEVDFMFQVLPPEQIEVLGAIDGVDIAQGPEFVTLFITYDLDQEPWNQLPVRQAIALAMNRQDMVDTVLLGAATPGNIGWTHPKSAVFNDSVKTEFDVAKANTILDDAGILDTDGDGIREYNGEPLQYEFLAPTEKALRVRLSELIMEYLGDIGIGIEVASIEWGTMKGLVWPEFDVANGRNYEIGIWGWSAPVQVEPAHLVSLIHSDPTIGTLNLSGFKSERADEVSNSLMAETDPGERTKLIQELQVVVSEELPFVILFYPDGVYAYWSSVYDNLAFIAGQGPVNKLTFLPEESRP
jgi:peptide/nickel transport system substrate-binding protein